MKAKRVLSRKAKLALKGLSMVSFCETVRMRKRKL